MKPIIIFKNPKKNDIALFFVTLPFLDNMVLQNLSRTNIGSYDQEIYVTPTIIARFLLQMQHFSFDLIRLKKTLKSKLRMFVFELYCHYWIACVNQTGAKVVLCFADNYFIFQRISILDKRRVYYAIQNGTRTLHCTRDTVPFPGVIAMTNYFCFGRRDIDMFSKQKHLIDNYLPVGSLVGGYYKTQISSGRIKKEYDLCFISQTTGIELHKYYNENTFYGKYQTAFVNLQLKLFEYLQTILRKSDYRMAVCLRKDSQEEAKFYEEYISDKCIIKYNDRQNYSSYRVVEQSELTISLNSTVLADVFSWGSKVLYANLLDSEWFEMPEAGISYYNKNDYEGFKNKINELINMDIENYRNITHKNAKYICNYNPEKPAHEIIRSTILKDIGLNQD
jgi:surface carbohydrate biosynthesis protein